jgi:molecular chaperone GrpE
MQGQKDEKDLENQNQEINNPSELDDSQAPGDHGEAEINVDHARHLIEMQAKIDELQDKLLRQIAETENVRTRLTRSIDETREYAIFNFCKDLVSVMDNLTRALSHVPSDMSDEVKNMIIGVEMTQKELASIFTKNGIEAIEPGANDKFDYNLHHAISQVAKNDQEPGTIVSTMQPGYKIKTRLIRPAAVSVAEKN